MPLFQGELPTYQLQAVKWLYAMHTNHLSSVLVEDRPQDRRVGSLAAEKAHTHTHTLRCTLVVSPARLWCVMCHFWHDRMEGTVCLCARDSASLRSA